jgi:hypothetical protein
MKKFINLLLVVAVISSAFLYGCAKKEASSSAAIEKSKTMATVEEKVNYLVGQAKAFYNSQDFQGAINIAQHVLAYLDKNSQEAKNLLEKAKGQLQAVAQKAAAGVTDALKGLGK